mmetsp:Transcript_32747/g.75355  ORF Transcript_32747/g.75355 Transcript_32747/m.75355 type:complete len:308 (-) Transcript_32747:304-1227(-)|eukprot:CAMPEP_0113301492 /NCGR_PEP_ID=MMETSP0010_2-20120614/2703_1 /TAXON_ID=216773 ORGANISM="Corethron hystrix, Strain 308" /NCGR_SAMPLE_ID=MMETSP0010_2 /ASSEMBLY_ACC=CAM_ASM_000155 /LENGTH=307 /DNA_ID=CAMNT_0000155133 /DNA_START=77 /DNA_END=1000 /DNA_ORIENTATION=+ /assembly_acc=CAM_ASM_000155
MSKSHSPDESPPPPPYALLAHLGYFARPNSFPYKILPRLSLFGIDLTLILFFGLSIASVRIPAYHLLAWNGWPEIDLPATKVTMYATSCLVALFHSTNLVVPLAILLSSAPFRPACRMAEHPRWWASVATVCLKFCTAYMIQDSVSILRTAYDPVAGALVTDGDDHLYLGHHFATASYMMICLSHGAGHMAAMSIMFFGELSNPLHNPILVMEEAVKLSCCDGPRIRSIHRAVFYAFGWVYGLLRVVIAPLLVTYLAYHFHLGKARGNLPLWARTYMTFVSIVGVLAGIPVAVGFFKTGVLAAHASS